MTTGSTARRIVLCDRHDDKGYRYEEASRQADGSVTIIGEDSGRLVEEFFGPGLSDYEWNYDVPADQVAFLVDALGGSPTDDVLVLLGSYYDRFGGAALGQVLRAEPVAADFDSYNT